MSDTIYPEGTIFRANAPITWDGMAAFQAALAPFDVRLSEVNIDSLAQESLARQIHERGVSSIITQVRLQEDFVKKSTPPDQVIAVIASLVDALGAKATLDLVDPYAFQPSKFGATIHAQRLVNAIRPALPNIRSLSIFYSKQGELFDEAVAAFETALGAAHGSPNVRLIRTHDFHDRFVIADRDRGIYIGTSINGLGSKYSLADFLRSGDAASVSSTLEAIETQSAASESGAR